PSVDIPALRLRNHKLLLRTLRLRSNGVNMTRVAQAQRRLRLDASARRAQLVDVGRKVFAEHGYEATSVEEIAERAGISKPIVYEHFGGKEGPYALVGMVAFVGQWWTESRKPPPVEAVAAHIAALAWMGLRHLPKRPTLLATTGRRS